jgi:copper oxidase (laccase) domain-containing protein
MVEKFMLMRTKKENLRVCISPSLGPNHAEFKNYKEEFPKSFWPFKIGESFYFNLWDIAKAQLIEAGVEDKNIEIKRVCTYANPKDYFSYRRENMSGRNATAIALLK